MMMCSIRLSHKIAKIQIAHHLAAFWSHYSKEASFLGNIMNLYFVSKKYVPMK
uniref:Uncharacterized protein MANES_07G017700 n=1 Tax=Rhizophora mucronata TaxID=61149 RepID=A0A2P2KNB0_RHIMU